MKSKKVTCGLFWVYLLALTWIIVFKFFPVFGELGHMRNINLVPFGQSVIVNGRLDFGEIIENVLVFIPFGLFLAVLWEEKPLIRKMIPIVLTSLLFETAQYLLAIGASDITDLITNSAGGVTGIGIAFGLSRIWKKAYVGVINTIALVGAVILILLLLVLLIANW